MALWLMCRNEVYPTIAILMGKIMIKQWFLALLSRKNGQPHIGNTQPLCIWDEHPCQNCRNNLRDVSLSLSPKWTNPRVFFPYPLVIEPSHGTWPTCRWFTSDVHGNFPSKSFITRGKINESNHYCSWSVVSNTFSWNIIIHYDDLLRTFFSGRVSTNQIL